MLKICPNCRKTFKTFNRKRRCCSKECLSKTKKVLATKSRILESWSIGDQSGVTYWYGGDGKEDNDKRNLRYWNSIKKKKKKIKEGYQDMEADGISYWNSPDWKFDTDQRALKYWNSMKKKKKRGLREDAQADKAIRDRIASDYAKIYAAIEKAIKRNRLESETDRDGKINLVRFPLEHILKLPEPLDLTFTVINKGLGEFGRVNGRLTIFLHAFPRLNLTDDPDEWNKEAIGRILPALKNKRFALVHEFTHYWDALRYKKGITAFIDASPPSGTYDDPSEYNAYYQNIIANLEQIGLSEIKRRYPDFESFFKFVTTATPNHKILFSNYGKDMIRKLRKRLYQFYHQYVKESNMRYANLIEDAQADKAIRDRISKDYSKVHAVLEELNKNPKKVFLEKKLGFIDVDQDKKIDMVVLHLDKILDLPKPIDLAFTVRSEKAYGGYGMTTAGKAAIALHIFPPERMKALGPEEWALEVQKNLVSVFEAHEDVFLHEFTHYWDSIRHKAGFEKFMQAPAFDTTTEKGRAAYVDNPTEYNAFYQQMMLKADRIVEKMIDRPRERLMQLYPNFDTFYKTFTEANPAFSHYSKEMVRKLTKRLYQYYDKYIKNAPIKEDLWSLGTDRSPTHSGISYWSDSDSKMDNHPPKAGKALSDPNYFEKRVKQLLKSKKKRKLTEGTRTAKKILEKVMEKCDDPTRFAKEGQFPRITKNYYRFRQSDPQNFEQSSFRTYKGVSGNARIVGRAKDGKSRTQSILIAKKNLSDQEIRKLLPLMLKKR
jgi:hypothetical protein